MIMNIIQQSRKMQCPKAMTILWKYMMNTLDCGSVVIAEHGKYEESINQREEA
jgi:hypothetical protein